MHEMLILKLLILIGIANATPVAAKLAFGDAYSRPIDGNTRFVDGRPLLGASKTLRGLVLSILITSAASALLGLGFTLGAVVGSLAMLGDLLSSFVKRRLGLAPSSMAIGLDQIPESLLPLLGALLFLPLTALDIAIVVALFVVGELLLSPILFRLNLRDKPY
jgi:CDP-diglyceride synthetase